MLNIPFLMIRLIIAASILLVLLAGCSGSGSDPGAPPVATADAYEVVQNTPTLLRVLDNDTDPDENLDRQSITITAAPAGSADTSQGAVTYTPPDDFVGTDRFRYTVKDLAGNTSNEATVTLTVVPVTVTSTSVQAITPPSTNYAARNSVALGGTVLASEATPFELAPNTVSFALMLYGDDVDPRNDGLIITHIIDPAGLEPDPLFRHVITCDELLCSAYLPRRPDQAPARGHWQFRLGTTASDLNEFDFDNLNMRLVARAGPAPDRAARARIRVKPWLTATSVSEAEFDAVLAEFVSIAAASNIAVELAPTGVLTEPRFAEVSADFSHPDTAELVSLGAAMEINIFFLESFRGVDGASRIGIAPGIPGTLGVAGNLNGVLINATITADTPGHARTTAEFAFHEMGHFLGLYHTTERKFSAHDVLDDTPACQESADANGNGDADVNECLDGLNILFWTNDFNQIKQPLSGDQQHVLGHSPLAVPE